MIDFTGVTALRIPEGDVTKVVRKSDGVVLWEKVASRLPREYQEVEYIHIPYNAYIDSGFTPADDTTFYIRLKLHDGYPFGTGQNPRLAAVLATAGSVQAYNASNGTNGIFNYMAPNGTVADIILEIKTYSSEDYCQTWINNETNGEMGPDGGRYWNMAFTHSMYIGAWWYNASSALRTSISDIYAVRAQIGSTQYLDLVPCYRKSDEVCGMYNLVDGAFLTNAGTGTITRGPEVGVPVVNLLPSALTPDNITTVFDGKGYKNGYYASAAEPFYNTDAAFFCSGLMPIPKSQTFYVKGCTMDTSLSHTRFGLMQQTGKTINTAVLADWNKDISVETLGTQYYKITINRLGYGAGTAYYFYFSASGTGDNVIVSATQIQ